MSSIVLGSIAVIITDSFVKERYRKVIFYIDLVTGRGNSFAEVVEKWLKMGYNFNVLTK